MRVDKAETARDLTGRGCLDRIKMNFSRLISVGYCLHSYQQAQLIAPRHIREPTTFDFDPVDRIDNLTHPETPNWSSSRACKDLPCLHSFRNEPLGIFQSARHYCAANVTSIYITITIHLVKIKSVLESEPEAVRSGASGMDTHAIRDGDGST